MRDGLERHRGPDRHADQDRWGRGLLRARRPTPATGSGAPKHGSRTQSAKGAFKDSTGKNRTIAFSYKDDGYDAARTIPLVDELLDSEKVFAIWTTGTPSGLKIYDKINARCVPQPTLISGSPAWGDPVNHPWTTGSLLSYGTEAVIWGAYIDQNFARAVRR